MLNGRRIIVTALGLWVAVGLGACSSLRHPGDVVKDRRAEYKSARSLPPLEVPPDLAPPAPSENVEVPEGGAGGSATFSALRSATSTVPQAGQRVSVLSEPQNVRVERQGDRQWLVVQAEPAQIWPKVRDFWVKNGFTLKVEDPRIGILETDWAENRADIPQDPIRRVLGRVFDQVYSAATRDKFRVRLEHGTKPGTTEIYLTQRGMEEVVQGSTTIWQPRKSDPELEAEMLKRMMVFLGVEEKKAGALVAATRQGEAPRATMIRDSAGGVTLTLNEDFSRAWRRTGLALDKVGFTVEDRDRSRGVYYVRYIEPEEGGKKGFLSKLAFWKGKEKSKSDEYVVRLRQEGDLTRVAVVDKQGNPEHSSTGQQILKLLYEQLK
jgi:outer membrane protein assembly factor BamC